MPGGIWRTTLDVKVPGLYKAQANASTGQLTAVTHAGVEDAREMSEAKGWKKLATNSAKLVNILGGYGYSPMLASMEACLQAAETGELA